MQLGSLGGEQWWLPESYELLKSSQLTKIQQAALLMEREMGRQSSGGLAPLVSSKGELAITFNVTDCLLLNLAHLRCFHFFIAFLRFEPQGNVPNFFLLVVPPE